MMLELLVIALGMGVSYFLNDVKLLSLNFEFMNTGEIAPDFLLILVIFFALYRGEFSGLWIGFFAGLLEDGIVWYILPETGEVVPLIGIHTLIYSLTAFAIGKSNHYFDQYNSAPIVVLVLVVTLLVRLSVWTLHGLLTEFNATYSIIGPAIYTGLFSPIWFALLAWVYRIHQGENV
ncbi:MAG: rod shape-determining protein MreD [Leptospiraceae bacterium]|nr:rod shape-determining protein MreD [Leptospiraceae bacterium]